MSKPAKKMNYVSDDTFRDNRTHLKIWGNFLSIYPILDDLLKLSAEPSVLEWICGSIPSNNKLYSTACGKDRVYNKVLEPSQGGDRGEFGRSIAAQLNR